MVARSYTRRARVARVGAGARVFRRAAVLAAVLLTTAASLVTASAPAAGAPAQYSPVMVVLDASGSMNASDAPGPRIDAAKAAVRTMVRDLPAGARVGLEAYGTSTGSSTAEKAAGCKDIKVLQPVEKADKSALLAQVDKIEARGYTPIGNALRKAAKALPAEGPRSIVLVSDGIDTCAPPDPCTVAKQLKKAGVDLIVNTVGFKVDAQARSQLSCIAAATGGSYHDADDGTSLTNELHVRVSRAMQPYSVVGRPIHGTANPADAPALHPGQYVDSYEPVPHLTDTVWRYYTVRLQQGETPYISATLVPSARRTSGAILDAEIELTDPTESLTCSFTGSSEGVNTAHALAPQAAVVSPGTVGGPTWPKDCPTQGTFLLKVARGGDAFADQPLPVELALRLEPPAATGGLPGPAAPERALALSASGAPKKIESGDSFNDAPPLRTGVYRDTVVSGESRYVKVHLGWGQRLAYRISFDQVPGVDRFHAVGANSSLASPVRAGVEQADGARTSVAFAGAETSLLQGTTLVPIRYANRTSTSSDVEPYAIDGDYYVAINAGFTNEGDPSITIPYTLTVQVFGTVQPGPRYRSTPTSQPSATSPARPSAAGHSSDSRTVSAASRTDSGTSTQVIVGGVLGGVVVVGLLVWLLLRRRRAHPANHT